LWAILSCHKDIENRTWPTRFRGEFLIHASAGVTKKEYREFVMWYERKFPKGLPVPAMEQLQRGGIVGKARITDCVDRSVSPWFGGPFGFVLADVVSLPFVPLKGELGLFKVPDDVMSVAA
jgi:hypothetical protein